MKAEMGQRGCPFLGTNGEKWPKIEYLAIFDHLSLLIGNPLIPPPLLLTKMLSVGAVSMKSVMRELLQAITTPFS